jgi:glycosyltransferase involved in cell wall biosynthesis
MELRKMMVPYKSLAKMVEYSAVIRSVGHNRLIDKLIESLAEQSLKPKEIVIVLPYGVPGWDTSYPNTRFIHSARGMVTQRAVGIKEARFRHLLLLDDDIIFKDCQAVERMFLEMSRHGAVMALPYSPEAFPQGKRRVVYALFGMAIPTLKRYLGYTAGGGFYYPKRPSFEQPYEVEGGYGRCIAADRDFLLKNHVLGDPDLEKVSYALRDDGAFVLDVVRHGGKAILVGNVPYDHLGGARKLSSQRLYQSFEASVFNNYVFWRKYIRGRYRRQIVPTIAFGWHLTGVFVFALLSCLRYKSVRPLLGAVRGFTKMVLEWGRGKR